MKRKVLFIIILILLSLNIYAQHILFPKNNCFGIKNNLVNMGNVKYDWVEYVLYPNGDYDKQVNDIKEIIQKDKRVLLVVDTIPINNYKYQDWLNKDLDFLEKYVKAFSEEEIVWVIAKTNNKFLENHFKEYMENSVNLIKKYNYRGRISLNFGGNENFIKNNSKLVLNQYVESVCFNYENYNKIKKIFDPYIYKGKILSYISLQEDKKNHTDLLLKYYFNCIGDKIEVVIWESDFQNSENKFSSGYYVYKNLCELFQENPIKLVNSKYKFDVLSNSNITNKSFYSKNKYNNGKERLYLTLWNEDNKEDNVIIVIKNLVKVRDVYFFDLFGEDYKKSFIKAEYEIRNDDLIVNRTIGETPQLMVIEF